jgi:hypothetical protein
MVIFSAPKDAQNTTKICVALIGLMAGNFVLSVNVSWHK